MSLPVSCEVPWIDHLSVNAMLVHRDGKLRHTSDYRRAKAHVDEHIMVGASGHRPTEQPVSVTMRCFFPDRRKRDAPNTAKLVLDAAQGWIYEDDSQVHRLTVERAGVDPDDPRVEITVRDYEED